MGRNHVITRHLISTLCIVLLLWGCERSAAVPAKPIVVRKKIVFQKDNVAKVRHKKAVREADQKETATPSKKAFADKVPIVPKSQSEDSKEKTPLIAKKTIAATPQKADAKTVELKKPTIKPKSDISEIKQPFKIEPPPSDNSAAADDKLIAAVNRKALAENSTRKPATYDPMGKIDPFEPLFKEKPVSVKKKESKKKKRIPRTPLERIDLSQLKLVGIILSPSGNMALVEESSGKGYVIKKGTYIGTNAGKVVKINQEKVIVEEEFEDDFGKVNTRKRKIKLPKPPGEF